MERREKYNRTFFNTAAVAMVTLRFCPHVCPGKYVIFPPSLTILFFTGRGRDYTKYLIANMHFKVKAIVYMVTGCYMKINETNIL